MGFANNVKATASNSYKSLVSNVDYHKMLSPDNCHKLCKYCVKIFLDLVFPRLRIASFCEKREGCRCYDSLKQEKINFFSSAWAMKTFFGKTRLISGCGNFVETHIFRAQNDQTLSNNLLAIADELFGCVSPFCARNSAETVPFHKFPHQEIRCNYCI